MQPEHGLEPGRILTGADIQRIFSCSEQGPVCRCSKSGATLVISNPLDSLQPDRWAGPVLHAVIEEALCADDLAQPVYLLEQVATDLYVFDGPVTPAAPYLELRLAADGTARELLVQPLQLVAQDGPPALPAALLEGLQHEGERRARYMSQAELDRRAGLALAAPSPRPALAPAYPRNPFVAELVRRRAGGHCMLCRKAAPFRAKGGRPFLEVHHVEWLSRGGADTPDNAAALCPDCHRRMHELDLEDDRNRLARVLKEPPEPTRQAQTGPPVASEAEVDEFYEALRAEAQAQSLPPRPASPDRLELEQ